MEATDVIKRPIITEASMLAMDEKKYTFEVDVRANKTLVKQSIEALFGVDVKNVNIVEETKKNLKDQFKSAGLKSSYMPGVKDLPEDIEHSPEDDKKALTHLFNLVKSGIPAEEILCSLADAIVLQNLSVLTRGSTLRHKVLLLGGPNTYLPFLQECWRKRIPETWAERSYDWYAGL